MEVYTSAFSNIVFESEKKLLIVSWHKNSHKLAEEGVKSEISKILDYLGSLEVENIIVDSREYSFRGNDKIQTWINSNLVSNALFSATNVHMMSGLLGVIVFIPGLFWGWLYARQGNLIGVSISHLFVGWTALFFLNLESLF